MKSKALAEELAAIPAATFATTKLAVRRSMIDAAREQGRQTDAAILDYWCSPAVLEQMSRFAARTIKRGN